MGYRLIWHIMRKNILGVSQGPTYRRPHRERIKVELGSVPPLRLLRCRMLYATTPPLCWLAPNRTPSDKNSKPNVMATAGQQ